MLYNQIMSFADWLRSRFDDWNNENGGEEKLADFARYLGVPPTSLSNWINSGYKPRNDNMVALVKKLGPETYDALGITRPPEVISLRDQLVLFGLPENFVDDLLETREEYFRELGNKGIVIDSPEGRQIVNKALVKLTTSLMSDDEL